MFPLPGGTVEPSIAGSLQERKYLTWFAFRETPVVLQQSEHHLRLRGYKMPLCKAILFISATFTGALVAGPNTPSAQVQLNKQFSLDGQLRFFVKSYPLYSYFFSYISKGGFF